ncbi:DDE-type integrase/transposase/recombinase [Mucilaginibacter xinganensis]|uniref:Transposase n=1 Tax=Mucilaginibacter xinganensis TaxID=1234841 RepID=A0A223NZX0_9SPHI|nr:DDE-type integrase/transposase/recombinase [Mucilaginibacter xinganensis]ASU35376.1 transposase [Mucilaginibacter xinganensis]
MNSLTTQQRVQILGYLVEGMSLRAASRLSGCSINTITKLLVDTGKACQQFHDENVHSLNTTRVEADEIWSFVYAKDSHVDEITNTSIDKDKAGDIWTWTAIDADSKLIVSYYVGDRSGVSATEFITDLKGRLNNRIQLTTDGLKAYVDAVLSTFGRKNIDFAQISKSYGSDNPRGDKRTERRYSPAPLTKTEIKSIAGFPDTRYISTSYIERQNLTMRMHMRRFTRLTNAFSKKLENHCYAIALHFVYYNFCKIHKTLRVTPAMQAGLMKDVMTLEDIVNLAKIEAPKKRGEYKKNK